MKKTILFCVALAGLTAMSSCGNKAATKLENAADSASYALGVSNGARFGEALKSGMYEQLKNIDPNDFMKGLAAALKTDSTQRSYEMGLSQGLYIKEMLNNIKQGTGVEIDIPTFVQAYKQAMDGDTTLLISAMQSNSVLDAIFRAAAEAKEKEELARLAETPEAKENLAKGEAFLAEKAKEEGMVKTESGLLYKVVKEGKGDKVQSNQRAKVSYKGTLIDGTQFDANASATFSPTQVVKGFGRAGADSPWRGAAGPVGLSPVCLQYVCGYGGEGTGGALSGGADRAGRSHQAGEDRQAAARDCGTSAGLYLLWPVRCGAAGRAGNSRSRVLCHLGHGGGDFRFGCLLYRQAALILLIRAAPLLRSGSFSVPGRKSSSRGLSAEAEEAFRQDWR